MSIFGSVTIRGNRITDAVQQTATVGIPIPFGYGKFVAQGNIVGNSELRERVIRRRQGKGGVKTEDYEYTCDYAIGFAEGPVYGYWTIKRQGKVVFSADPAFPVEDQAYATKWMENVELYYGTEAQLPDPTLEAIYGVGQVSAMRGLAYIVVKNDNVTANQGAVPPYEAILVGSADLYLTTKPYPLEVTDRLSLGVNLSAGELRTLLREYSISAESLNLSTTLVSGSLNPTPVRTYVAPPESLDVSATITAGELRTLLRGYGNWVPEPLNVSGTLVTGELRQILITYNNWPSENLNVNATLQAGYLGP